MYKASIYTYKVPYKLTIIIKQMIQLENGQNTRRNFSEEDIQMANKHIKTFKKLLVTGEIHFKP